MQLWLKACRIQTHKWCSAHTYSSTPTLSSKLKQPFAQRGRLYVGKGRHMGIIATGAALAKWLVMLGASTLGLSACQVCKALSLQNMEYLMFWVVELSKGAQEEGPENQWSGSQYYCRFLFLCWFWECLFYCVGEIPSFLILDLWIWEILRKDREVEGWCKTVKTIGWSFISFLWWNK